jgi:predicted dithiol-disulfide oxidoreductase (DUF899 family)
MTSDPDVFRQTNLVNESSEYMAQRDQLRLAEIELMRHLEKVAERRRQLPQGPEIQDYVFEEGPANLNAGDSPVRTVRISQLFTAADRALIIYHFMFGRKNTKPCPMCTAWIDCMNGIAAHLAQNVDLAIVAAADPAILRAHARARGWNKLRLLSARTNSFKYDLGSEDREGNQDSEVSVFVQDRDKIRHFYSSHPRMSPEIKERGLDLLNPIWNVLDLTPHGRGDFYTSLAYGTVAHR